MKILAPQIIRLLADYRKPLIQSFLEDIQLVSLYNHKPLHTTTSEEYMYRFGEGCLERLPEYSDDFYQLAISPDTFNPEFNTAVKYDANSFDTSQEGVSQVPRAGVVQWMVKTTESILKKIFANPPHNFNYSGYSVQDTVKDVLRTTVLMDDYYQQGLNIIFTENDLAEGKKDVFSQYLACAYTRLSGNGKQVVDAKFKLAFSGYSDVTLLIHDESVAVGDMTTSIYKEFQLNSGNAMSARGIEFVR